MTRRVRIIDREHLERVKALPCIVCGRMGPSDAHHVRVGPDGRHYGMGQKADDTETIPLCKLHHQYGDASYHAGPRTFVERYGHERMLLEKTLALLSVYDVD